MFSEKSVKEGLLKILALSGLILILLQPATLPLYLLAAGLLVPAACCVSQGGGRGLLMFLFFLLLFFISQYRYLTQTVRSLPFSYDRVAVVEARLLSEAGWDSRGDVRITAGLIRVEEKGGGEAEASGNCTITVAAERCISPEQWFQGDVIRVGGRMAEPQGRTDCRFYGRQVFSISRSRPVSLRIWIHRYIKEKAEDLGGYSQLLLPALVLGQRDPRLEEAAVLFRETGTAHIIALSGFHSGLVALLLFLVLRPLLGYRTALVFSAAGLLFYLYLAGPKPSLQRAVLMYVLVIGGKLQLRKIHMKRVLAVSFFLSAILVPASLQTLSARLSYLALWGILDSTGLFSSLMSRRLPRIIALPLSAGMAAQIWTFPLVIFSFGTWYPAGIPASLVLTPLVTFYMYSGILYLFLPRFLSLPFVFLCRFLELLLTAAAQLFRRIPPFVSDSGPGVFLFLLFPLLLGLIYRPGGFNGERKSRSQLRFNFRDQSAARSDGAGTPQALGTELSDQPRSQREDYQAAGPAGG